MASLQKEILVCAYQIHKVKPSPGMHRLMVAFLHSQVWTLHERRERKRERERERETTAFNICIIRFSSFVLPTFGCCKKGAVIKEARRKFVTMKNRP